MRRVESDAEPERPVREPRRRFRLGLSIYTQDTRARAGRESRRLLERRGGRVPSRERDDVRAGEIRGGDAPGRSANAAAPASSSDTRSVANDALFAVRFTAMDGARASATTNDGARGSATPTVFARVAR